VSVPPQKLPSPPPPYPVPQPFDARSSPLHIVASALDAVEDAFSFNAVTPSPTGNAKLVNDVTAGDATRTCDCDGDTDVTEITSQRMAAMNRGSPGKQQKQLAPQKPKASTTQLLPNLVGTSARKQKVRSQSQDVEQGGIDPPVLLRIGNQ
jgi:hypothetical protein